MYESCNQISDSLDAYQRAAELDPQNKHIQQRLNSLREAQNASKTGGTTDPTETKDKDKDRTPMTMVSSFAQVLPAQEPRATPAERSARGIGQQGSLLTVPDLVDLSTDEKRTLPSPDSLNSPPFRSNSETK